MIAADHAHVDMWSMLVIARDLLSALDAGSDGRELLPGAAPAFVEHTQALLDRNPAPDHVRTGGKRSSVKAAASCRNSHCPWVRPIRSASVWKFAMSSISMTVPHLLRKPATTVSRRSHSLLLR